MIVNNISIYTRTMSDTGIEHTFTKLNIETYTDEQLIELGKNIQHKKIKQRHQYNNDFCFRNKRKEQGEAYYDKN